MNHDPDSWRFREYAENHTNDSPVDLSGREGAPRPWTCDDCGVEVGADEAHACPPARIWLQRGQASDPAGCTLSHVSTDGNGDFEYVRADGFQALVDALRGLVAADNCNYDRAVMRSEGYFDVARKALAAIEEK